MAWGMTVQPRVPTLQAGRLRHIVDIAVQSPVQDSAGGINPQTTIVYARVWATVSPMSGQELWAAQQYMSKVTHQVVIRYIGAAPGWLGGLSYLQNALVKDSNGYLQQAQGPGLSGATAPVWNLTAGGLTHDGNPSTGITWKNVGLAPARTGITSKMLVLFNGRTFQVEAVFNPEERNRMLILQCCEIDDSVQQGAIPGTGGYTTQTVADVVATAIAAEESEEEWGTF